MNKGLLNESNVHFYQILSKMEVFVLIISVIVEKLILVSYNLKN